MFSDLFTSERDLIQIKIFEQSNLLTIILLYNSFLLAATSIRIIIEQIVGSHVCIVVHRRTDSRIHPWLSIQE